MKLTGQQMGACTTILCDAFTLADLIEVVLTELNFALGNDVAMGQGLRVAALQLIDKLNREERALELVRAVRKARPTVVAVVSFCDPLLKQAEKGTPAEADELRRAAADCHQALREREDLFQFLNVSKELHDVLHHVQSYHPSLRKAVAARAAAAGLPLAEDAASTLQDWLNRALENVKATEFPKSPPAWIGQLTTVVAEAIGPAPAKWEEALVRLAGLPAKWLGRLNDKLIDYARRLDARGLSRLVDRVRAAIGPDGTTPDVEQLRGALDTFGGLCSQLASLIDAHDLCQKVDDALREAVGLPEVSKDSLFDWAGTKGLLTQLATCRPGGDAKRMADAARDFETAADRAAVATAFAALVECFDHLFLEVDKALLKVTNRLVIAAWKLDSLLEKFL